MGINNTISFHNLHYYRYRQVIPLYSHNDLKGISNNLPIYPENNFFFIGSSTPDTGLYFIESRLAQFIYSYQYNQQFKSLSVEGNNIQTQLCNGSLVNESQKITTDTIKYYT